MKIWERILHGIKKARGTGAPALYVAKQTKVGFCKRGAMPDFETEENTMRGKFSVTIPLFDLAVIGSILCLIALLFGKNEKK